MLRAEVDYGFERLTDATQYVVGDIQEEIKLHADIKMDKRPKQNDYIMQEFVNMIELWVLKDHQCNIAPHQDRINTPSPFHFYYQHPQSCGLSRYWALIQFHDYGIATINYWGTIMSCVHLYNAVNGSPTQDIFGKNLSIVVMLQKPKPFFISDAPSTPDESLKRLAIAIGALKVMKELGSTMQAFRTRICDANGLKDIRAEDLRIVLENGSWEYELDHNGNAQEIYRDIGKTLEKASAKQLSVSKCVGLIRDLLHAEVVDIAFGYFRLHQQCWRLLQRDSQLPFIEGNVLITASRSQKLGGLLKGKQPGVQVTKKVLEGARYVLEGLVESRAGGLIAE
ncbi:hypothetical protein N0V86_007793 [Didymella sp. IMI 355093]|nr:hypothetical protein N0V86_007793 [Didymella sp. IMI 355093]